MMKPIPILCLDNTFTFGGAINSLLYLLRALDKNKYEPILVTGQPEPFLQEKFHFIKWYHVKIRVPWIHNKLYKQIMRQPLFLNNKLIAKVARRIRFFYWIVFITLPEAITYYLIGRRHKVKLVHLNNILGSQLAGIIAAKLLRVPCVAHLRDFEQVDFVTKFYATLIDHHVAISNAIKKNLLELDIPENQISLIWDAIDLDDFNKKPLVSCLYNEFEHKTGEKFFGIFGRVVGWKGIKEFVRASAIVFDRFPNCRAFVVGDSSDANNEYFEEVKDLACQLGIQHKVVFTGFREDISEMMGMMDIVVHASTRAEPFGMVLIEGMAAGKPIVATKAGGPIDIVDNMKTGILVEMGNSDEMANAILKLLENTQLSKKMGVEGQKRATQYFNKEKYAGLINETYRQFL